MLTKDLTSPMDLDKSQLSRGGTLSILPPEIRNEIYKNALSEKYLVFGRAFWNFDRSIHSIVPADLSLLCISKPLREEVLSVLLTHSNFRCAIQHQNPWWFHAMETGHCLKFAPPIPNDFTLDMIKKLMKIELVFDMVSFVGCPGIKPFDEEAMGQTRQYFIDPYIGTEKARDTFSIVFHSVTEWRSTQFIKIDFFKSMKALTVLKKIVIRADSTYYDKVSVENFTYDGSPKVPDRTPSKAMNRWLGKPYLDRDYRNGESFLQTIRKELEPVLGPCTEGDVQDTYNVVFSRFLEFHPREHHARTRVDELWRAEVAELESCS